MQKAGGRAAEISGSVSSAQRVGTGKEKGELLRFKQVDVRLLTVT